MKSAREVVLDSMRANASYVESLASDSKENIFPPGSFLRARTRRKVRWTSRSS